MLSPVTSRTLTHAVLEHGLHQAMDGERLGVGIASQQGIFKEFFDRHIQLEWVGSYGLKRGTQFR